MLKPVPKVPLEIDELFPLLENSPLLDIVKEVLTKRGLDGLAQSLLKLETDAGVQISLNKEDFAVMHEKEGSVTAELYGTYEIIDRPRMVNIFQQVYSCFMYAGPQDPEGSALRQGLKELMQGMNIPLSAPRPKHQPNGPR